MSLHNKESEMICASHILIPYKNGRTSEKKLRDFAFYLNNAIVKNKKMFGPSAYHYSLCPSGQNNSQLNLCINKIVAKNEKEFRKKAEECVTLYSGSLGCFTRDQVDRNFFDATQSLKIGEITKSPIKTRFGYHIIRRDPAPPK